MLVRQQISSVIRAAIKDAPGVEQSQLDELSAVDYGRGEGQGDLVTPVAMRLAKPARRNPREIAEEIAEAIRAASDYALAHNNLARAYERKGRVDAAIRHYRTALRIRPDYSAARERLDRLTGERPIAETLPSGPEP